MNIRSNSIVSKDGNQQILFPYGVTVSSGQLLNVQGNLNISGIATVGFLTAKNANVTGVITATTFSGGGSNLTGIAVVSTSKLIALRYILGDHPHRV